MFKKTLIFLAVLSLFISSAYAAPGSPTVSAPCALLMEKATGTILFEQNADELHAPASVTKVMTLLLISEAIENGQLKLDDMVATSQYAASMGGSQIFLEEGEQMRLEDMLKSVIISSANDAAVALAEHLAGSEESFVSNMNQRAAQLGMKNTTFKNCTGLDAEGHQTTVRDIALMSRELLKHDFIKKYTTTWIDTVRNGEFGLANTNKLVRFYKGATGLKTGFTSTAMYCLSASAERDGMELIAVVMNAPSSDERFASAKSLLDFGFANYALLDISTGHESEPVRVILGETDAVGVKLAAADKLLVEKSQINNVKKSLELAENVEAPVEKGQELGRLIVSCDGKELASIPLVACDSINRLSLGKMLGRLLSTMLMAK